ncbi:hypothetical protein [Proteiniclasticum sp. QWL-01]|uniref:hypothetical protein n=1 Tax=Proteiniclasticum sp. QWL-01 TaxID=3036945 RepID=UPI00240F44B9|nr:hypothetical protein [Proteiniclasticum sp. QWL-01]WFF71816.1 hypothetical protein P6M73_10920 [Proteiniclasticum sp. QWL-01]
MQVEFNTKNLLGRISVTPDLKNLYEAEIKKIVEKYFDFIDISNLEKIIIPDNFVSEVLEFQKNLYIKNPSVTDNDFGRALGKMLYDSVNNKFYIFIDPQLATFLIDDELFNIYFNNLDDDNTRRVISQRQYAYNLLCHELAHMEFHSNTIAPDTSTSYDHQIKSLIFNLFDEYYACRRSIIIPSDHYSSFNDEYIGGIEQRITEEKWRYKTRESELHEFVGLFHALTNQCLLGMVSVLGSLGGEPLQQHLFVDCKLGIIVNDFNVEFDNTYYKFIRDKAISFSPLLSSVVKNYYDSFRVFLSQRDNGVYYDIPD